MNPPHKPHYDVIIIGGGPAGLSAALLLGRSCRSVVVIDAGRPRNAAAREIHGLLGRDVTDPRALLRDGRREVAKYDVEVIDDTVTEICPLPSPAQSPQRSSFLVTTKQGRRFQGRKLLFGTGMCDELPELPGLRECYGASVHHCPYCDGWEHRSKRLMAYGEDASSASGLGMLLRCWSERVTVLTNGQSIAREQAHRLADNGIAISDEHIERLLHDGDQLTGVQLRNGASIAADALFFNSGRHQSSDLPRLLGCELEDDGSTPTNRKQKTNIAGVFLAGDAAGHVQFVSVAVAEGATAAVAINRELQDEERL